VNVGATKDGISAIYALAQRVTDFGSRDLRA
jgi:hypothetical protein